MTNRIDVSKQAQSINLDDGHVIVLVDRLSHSMSNNRAQNVFRIDKTGTVVWTSHSRFDSEGQPFTRLHLESGRLTAYRWDGGTYAVELDTGFATPLQLER